MIERVRLERLKLIEINDKTNINESQIMFQNENNQKNYFKKTFDEPESKLDHKVYALNIFFIFFLTFFHLAHSKKNSIH